MRRQARKLTATFTSDFQHEFRAETGVLLRRRLIWFIAIRGAIGLLLITLGWAFYLVLPDASLATLTPADKIELNPIGNGAVGASLVALWGITLLYVLYRARRHEDLLKLSQWLIFLEGVIWLSGRFVFATEGDMTLIKIMLVHIVASLCFPWTATQALRPMAGVLALNAFGLIVETFLAKLRASGHDALGQPIPPEVTLTWPNTITAIVLSPLIAAPGTVFCAFRHSRRLASFRFRHVLDRYGDLRRELTDARRIHEGLFPAPIEDGDVRFSYLYQPMRQIGGDFLFSHCRRDDAGRMSELSVVLTDVTGHGIAAALTVNRLHGELERVFAEDPDVGPGDVLRLLNRYVHLTLARHSVYMTAFCLRVRPDEGVLEYASGGHPPAFLKAVNGTVEHLQSTAFVLGACRAEDFDPGPVTLRFGPGDVLIAYTDGATEARGHDGRMLGIVGIQRIIASAGPAYERPWSEHLLRAVDDFRDGPPADDTLIVELVHAGRPGKPNKTTLQTPESIRT